MPDFPLATVAIFLLCPILAKFGRQRLVFRLIAFDGNICGSTRQVPGDLFNAFQELASLMLFYGRAIEFVQTQEEYTIIYDAMFNSHSRKPLTGPNI